MTCKACKKNFNPREQEVEAVSGFGETVEVAMVCPDCGAYYSHWIDPTQWDFQGE